VRSSIRCPKRIVYRGPLGRNDGNHSLHQDFLDAPENVFTEFQGIGVTEHDEQVDSTKMRSPWQAIACAALVAGTACVPRVLVDDDAGHEDDDDATTHQ
jgi:hypothetical protein